MLLSGSFALPPVPLGPPELPQLPAVKTKEQASIPTPNNGGTKRSELAGVRCT
jgi:hypothetical protein